MNMPVADKFLQPMRLSIVAATAISGTAIFIIAVADILTTNQVNFAILYVIPLLACAAAQYRRLMWAVAAITIVLTITLFMAGERNIPDELMVYFLINRILTASGLAVVAVILHWLVGAQRKVEQARAMLEQRREELETANAELEAREEEISAQNEELQSQAEELERQSEELRISNEELAQREATLQVLLSLSRTLTADLSPGETMEQICRTLHEILDQDTAAAILRRDGEVLRVDCQHNLGQEGLVSDVLPFTQSFASLVLERNRTGFLEDVSLRPDLRIVQPRGTRQLQSVLAAPLRLNGRPVGTLEAYSFEKRSWSDQQISMIESLAAQASVSLQAAELYERIEQERTRLQAVLETVPFSVMISNADASDVRLNPAGAAMRRVPANVNLGPLTGQRWRLFQNGMPVTEEAHPLVRAMRQGEPVQNCECELVVDGGARYTILISAAPIRDAQGTIIGGVAASADITEQKRLQLQLDARRREAEEASVRKTRFLAAVSHDIRTPANAISLLAELMQRSANNPEMQKEIPEIAADLRKSAMTLVSLVSDVLDITRFDSGRIDLEESEFALESLVMDESRQLQALAREKGIEFRCEPTPEPILIRADRVKVQRILGNLISNAVKFTQHGHITVRTGWSADRGASIEIDDTGPGIPLEFQSRIFDEFFQLKQAGGNNGGSGLGLAISKRLAEAMGGTLTLRSEPGRGSTFTFSLPPSARLPG
jgi:signal transduction histidine kinase